ncbi:MAG: chromosome segregation protein SMC [Clostridium sp.]|nr:chromosome segregation protein SMC [Clostridium sp.]MCM1547231.1 chromosome segregation protein SMC [Ruminococcus sp.]
MYLKSLELQGFKSFPDKIKLNFDTGLTAVVGPNGSGKSNIGDSIRWVLGEQSTKTLRGNKMEDVIFSGTVARKPVGFAAVTLTLDNSDRTLNSDDDEVSVTRKLYRSGDSEYKINGRNVRLRDINELFMDTGLGRDGYSIIGQGRIAEIVSAKSGERRDIFEEAAGISKFRYKKTEAERKLSAAQENLLRLNDIVAELENRVGPLKHQAEKAEKFVVLAEERKKLEISVWVHRIGELKEKLDQLENSLLINKNEYQNIQNDIEREEEKINDGYRKIQESSVKVEQLRDLILETEKKSSDYKSDIAVFKNDISYSEESIKSIEEQKKSYSKDEMKFNADMEKKLAEIDAIREEAKKIADRLIEVEKGFEKAQLENESLSKDSDKAGNEINILYMKQSEYRSQIAGAQSAAKDAADELENMSGQENSLKEQTQQYAAEKADILDGIKAADEKAIELKNKLEGYNRLYNDKQSKLSGLKKHQEELTLSIKEKQQRKKLLADLESSMEGFAHSVKEIMKASSVGKIGGIKGTVAQLINVKAEYALAIETALGGAMQNIVVEDDNAAKRCIRMLKENRSGRATFLPLTAVKGNKLNEPRISGEDGFVALGCELVEFDACYTNIVNSLLGRTAVAEDIDSAAMIAKKYGYKFRIVTLDGQLINAGGSFTGGSAVRSAGVFSRKNEIDSLTLQIDEFTKRLDEGNESIHKLGAVVSKLMIEIDGVKAEQTEVLQDKIRFEAELSRVDVLEKQTASQLNEFETRLEILKNRREKSDNTAADLQKKLIEVGEMIKKSEEELARTRIQKEDIRDRRENLSAEMSELKIQSAEFSKDIQRAESELDMLKESSGKMLETLKILEIRKKEQENLINEKKLAIEERKKFLEEISGSVVKYNDDIKHWQNVHREQDIYVENLRSGIKELNEAKEKYSGEITKAQERKENVQSDFDGIINQLYEVYELTRSEAEAIAEKLEDIVGANKRLSEIKSRIKQLGNVNVAAIEEYKEVSERYDFLSKQLEDVRSSKRELENLIEELTQDMCRIFAESFVIINNNFKEIFRELFGGGKAELVLTDPENVLESGIEIRVAPPGKVIKNLISLSGGEQSFVAICIYFSILRLRPSPFCILDEIDAALDEVNVKKYAQYLKNFTDKTQFVLVTHRRSAMEEANVLYGVTMQEDGISKLLKMEQPDSEAV